MLVEVAHAKFPEFQPVNVNMMPFRIGEPETLPAELHPYLPLVDACWVESRKGKVAYLTVQASYVEKGQTQRRGGVHTEGTNSIGWGTWGGTDREGGIYMASTDGACRAWNTTIPAEQVDDHGALLTYPSVFPTTLRPGVLYWLTDRTPHEALPALVSGPRQYFRLVVGELGAWHSQHSTPNPFGVLPEARVIHESKFDRKGGA
jgi:hypothetical protein